MKIVKYTPEHFAAWEFHCSRSGDAWFWHTRSWHTFLLELLKHLPVADHGFMVMDGSCIVAIAPCVEFFEPDSATRSLGSKSYPVPWPAFSPGLTTRQKQEAERLIFEEYMNVANRLNLACIRLFGVIQAPTFYRSSFPPANLGVRHGYTGHVYDTHVISLDAPLDELWKAVRKGHKSSIKSGQKKFEIQTWLGDISEDDFRAYQSLHAAAAGRVTRSQTTFEIMRDWIRVGRGLMVGARSGDQWLGFVYVFLYKEGAYYASACNHPEANDLSIGHALLWEAIQRSKAAGIKLFEVGIQTYPSSASLLNEDKLISISRFKRGFGGFAMPRYEATLEISPPVGGAA